MTVEIINMKSSHPETYHRWTLIEIKYINSTQIRSLNLVLFNILIKISAKKK